MKNSTLNNIIRIITLIKIASCHSHSIYAQEKRDTVDINLQPVEIKAYFIQQPLMNITSSTQILSPATLTQQHPVNPLSAVNTIPGIRMEERSPGSYRLAMRGSLIRSPFGIRNTRIFIDEFPLTDAGGNSYLNLLDLSGISTLQVIKGPDGSIFGANSGGIVQITPKGFGTFENNADLVLTSGSYGLFAQQLSLQRKFGDKYQFSLDQSFTRSDGYRMQTGLNKKTFQTAHQWNYSPNKELRLFILYTDLHYQTPGGLTQAQYNENPRAARPIAGAIPGAKEQNAGIYNKTVVGGLTNQTQLTQELSHTISVYGAFTDFENPFITNYEFRDENNLGTRSYFSWNKDFGNVDWQMQLGGEVYWGWNERKNYDNNKGQKGSQKDHDKLNNRQLQLFYRTSWLLWDRWNIEGSLGFNKNSISYQEYYPIIPEPSGNIDFRGIWMPRIASSYQLARDWSWRISIARGYSTPTLEEIRPSDRILNKDLRAEIGTNTETGLRYYHHSNRWLVDISAYHYQMKNGIVRQLNERGEDYYVNAGQMNQNGVELSFWGEIIPSRTSGIVQRLSWNTGLTYNHYQFGTYRLGDNDFDNNKMTGVPDWVITNTAQLSLIDQFYLNIYYNYTSSLPLNDANTVFAKKYHLVQAKLSKSLKLGKDMSVQLFCGVDNLLNEKYSLGNDINAFGGRFFNPSPARNYYGGIKFQIK